MRIVAAAFAATERLTTAIAMTANACGTLVLLGLVAVVNYDVVARGFFNAPFMGAYEVVVFSMALIVFLQLPDVVRVDRLTRSDGFLILLDGIAPRAGAVLRRLIDALAALFMGLVAWAVWPDVVRFFDSGRYFGVPGVFTAPWWPIKLTIVFGTGLCALILVLKVMRPRGAPSHSGLAGGDGA